MTVNIKHTLTQLRDYSILLLRLDHFLQWNVMTTLFLGGGCRNIKTFQRRLIFWDKKWIMLLPWQQNYVLATGDIFGSITLEESDSFIIM